MKHNFSKSGSREKIDKIERKASVSGASQKERSSKKRLSIYEDFEEEELDDIDSRSLKHQKSRR